MQSMGAVRYPAIVYPVSSSVNATAVWHSLYVQLGMLVLAMMLPCQCMMPRPREEGDFDYTPVAMAQPILQEEIVYEDA